MEWYKVTYRSKYLPPTSPADWFFTKAENKKDAIRIVEGNMDTTRYDILDAFRVEEDEITKDAITIGCMNPWRK